MEHSAVWITRNAPLSRAAPTVEFVHGLGLKKAGVTAMRLHQCDPVAERILYIDPVETGEGLVLGHRDAGEDEPNGQCPHVIDQKRRMGFTGRLEVRVDTEMDPDVGLL